MWRDVSGDETRTMATISRNDGATAAWVGANGAGHGTVPFATEQVENAPSFFGLSGRSPAIRQLIAQLQQIAPHFYLGTIEGEEGTGKTLAAQALHAAGPAAAGPFVCCPTSRFLREAEEDVQHGWSKDVLREANGGMLFLDNIHQLSAGQQEILAEFLHWLDDRRSPCVRPDTALVRPSSLDGHRDGMPAQIVFSSSLALRQSPEQTFLRDDVASRLGAVRFHLPPLSERREDIPLLAQIFIQRFARTYSKTVRGLGPGTIPPLMRYDWPGNVRELENVISAAALETESQWIRPIDLPPLTAGKRKNSAEQSEMNLHPGPDGKEPVGDTDWNLDHAIRGHVMRALERTKGNKLRAAHLLGISRSTLYRILGSDEQ